MHEENSGNSAKHTDYSEPTVTSRNWHSICLNTHVHIGPLKMLIWLRFFKMPEPFRGGSERWPMIEIADIEALYQTIIVKRIQTIVPIICCHPLLFLHLIFCLYRFSAAAIRNSHDSYVHLATWTGSLKYIRSIILLKGSVLTVSKLFQPLLRMTLLPAMMPNTKLIWKNCLRWPYVPWNGRHRTAWSRISRFQLYAVCYVEKSEVGCCASASGKLKMTIPDKPNSRLQKYVKA